MKKGYVGVSPARLGIAVLALVAVTVGVGVAVHLHGTKTAGNEKQKAPASAPAASSRVWTPADDWIGFHNGGGLTGVASSINAPPMKVRWTRRMDDLEAADPPATRPTLTPSAALVGSAATTSPSATQPAGSPATVATTSPASAAANGPTTVSATAPAVAPVYQSHGHFEAGAAIVGGYIYIADTGGHVRAISIADGKVRWSFLGDDGFETTPLVLNGKVFIGDLGGMFYALSADDGKKLWFFDANGGQIHASANYLGEKRDKIIFATDDADIFCLDANTGKQVWNARAGGRINSGPAVSNGSALISGCDSQLRAIRGADGTEEFTADLGAVCPGSTAVDGDRLVLGTDQGRVMCISAKTHQQLWLFTGISEGAMVYGSPAVADGIVVAGARDSNVYGLDLASGKKLWSFPTRGDVDASPAVSGGRVYVASKDKKLYVLDLKTGRQLWSFTAGRGIAASPAIGDGIVVIADEGGHLICLE